jgi:hypothetical protein
VKALAAIQILSARRYIQRQTGINKPPIGKFTVHQRKAAIEFNMPGLGKIDRIGDFVFPMIMYSYSEFSTISSPPEVVFGISMKKVIIQSLDNKIRYPFTGSGEGDSPADLKPPFSSHSKSPLLSLRYCTSVIRFYSVIN